MQCDKARRIASLDATDDHEDQELEEALDHINKCSPCLTWQTKAYAKVLRRFRIRGDKAQQAAEAEGAKAREVLLAAKLARVEKNEKN